MAMVSSQGRRSEDRLSCTWDTGSPLLALGQASSHPEDAVSLVCDALGTLVQGRKPPGRKKWAHSTFPP